MAVYSAVKQTSRVHTRIWTRLCHLETATIPWHTRPPDPIPRYRLVLLYHCRWRTCQWVVVWWGPSPSLGQTPRFC